ncbi:hypothetical protein OQA88_944 [Cercophora sp. LCS_1]
MTDINAGPNEQRTISREHLGFYHSVIIGAVYEFNIQFEPEDARYYLGALRHCVEEHPFLSALVGDRHTDRAYYHRATTIKLAEHLLVLDRAEDGNGQTLVSIEQVLRWNLDQPFTHTVPPWRVVVLPLPRTPLGAGSCFITFCFSHTILDGPSGVAFHRTFRSALLDPTRYDDTTVFTPPSLPFPPPFDTPSRLPISWSFLLGPLLAAVLPNFLTNALGLQAHASPVNPGTWTGTPTFFDKTTTHSNVILRSIPAPLVTSALRASKANGAKLTGVMHQLITRALSKAIATNNPDITNFASQTAINMRRAAGIDPNEMGEYASGVFLSHPVVHKTVYDGPLTEEDWAAARHATERFADAASRLSDQPIGLLRYAPSIRKWTEDKLGKARDSSYEVSNIGVFDGGDDDKIKIVDVVFAQPGMVVGCPFCFNVASIKGGGLIYSVTWTEGALGVEDEKKLAEEVCETIREGFERF